MTPNCSGPKRVDRSRRRLLAAVAGAGVCGLAGCSGGGGDTADDGDDDDDSGGEAETGSPTPTDTPEPSQPTGSDCPQWSSVSPYAVSGTDFAVVPSFPTGWTQYNESYTVSSVEVSTGYPGSATDGGTSYPDFVAITQLTASTEKNFHEGIIEEGIYERDDPVVIGGEEFVVGREDFDLASRWHFTVPGPRDTYLITQVGAATGRESCVDGVRPLGRAVIDSLEVNPETTL